MKVILEKFSPPMTNCRVGDEVFSPKSYPSIPEKVFDFHGYIQDEIPRKITWTVEYSYKKKLSYIRIVTGVGKNIIFSKTLQSIKAEQKKDKKISIIPLVGVIDIFFQ